jgi:hypothetical protein
MVTKDWEESMRLKRTVLYLAGMALVVVLGCKHQPELKPPDQPEVLASPGDKDKRYDMPTSYPPDVLASDPNKKQDGIMPAGGKRNSNGASSSMGMSGTGGGSGAGGPGTPPSN